MSLPLPCQVLSRLKNVEGHRESLIKTLRDSPEVRLSPMDKLLQSSFRVADEAVLFDFTATHNSRPGRVFLTYSHLWFHSQIIGFTLQKVMPFRTVKSVELSMATPLGGKALVVTDQAGERSAFVITNINPPDFPERVLDVIVQVLEVWKADDQNIARATQGGGEGEEGQGVDGTLEVVKQLESLSVSVTREKKLPPGEEALFPLDSPTSQENAPLLGLGSGDARLPGSFSPGAAAPSASSEEPVSPPQPPSPPPAPAPPLTALGKSRSSSMRLGIQAFLEESQGAPKKPATPALEPLLDFS